MALSDSTRRALARELLSALWQQPLWAVPFGVFFGLISGGTWPYYVRAFQVSLVFAFVIRFTIAATEFALLPWLKRRFAGGGRLPIAGEAAAFGISALGGSLLAAYVVHLTLVPGMMSTPRGFMVSLAYSVVFVCLVGGIVYAIHFYRESMARARAVERMRAELAEAELRALRAQVNPHFLFNTLNSIAALVRENPVAAEDTVTRLAEIFRYVLTRSDRAHARLGEELAFVRTYLEIERTRFGERLRLVEEIAPEVEDALLPTLLLQPLVENAVRYAVSSRPEGATLRLRAHRDGELLRLEVADDGPGMDAGAAPGGTGFGLHSVRERLQAAGPPHRLEIGAAPGGGASIRLTLPWLTSASPSPRTPGGFS